MDGTLMFAHLHATASVHAMVIGALAALGWAGGVHAEEAPTTDEIIVTGQRAADKNAIAAKQEATQIVDAISADDIGRMADFSAGDALRRIAGVNTYNYQGEPRFIAIRGFNSNYVATTLDGIQIASPDNQNQNNGGGRQFYVDSLPSNIASRIEVFKTNTADMDGHSIGGSVNFKLPSAFDFKKNQFRISARAGIQMTRPLFGGDKPVYQGEFMFTRRIGDTLGIAINASYWRRKQQIAQAERGSSAYWYNASGIRTATPYVGTGPVPVERRWYIYDNDRQRKSVLGKIDWRPSDNLSASAVGFYFTQHETAIRNDTIANISTNALLTNYTATSGTLSPRTTSAGDVTQDVRQFALDFDRKTYGGQAQISYRTDSGLLFDVRGGYRFHITLAYLIRNLDAGEQRAFRAAYTNYHQTLVRRCPVIELGPPEYCTMEDMFAFHRQFYL